MTPEQIDRTQNRGELERIPRYIPSPQADIELQPGSLPLSHYLWILKRSKWKIFGFHLRLHGTHLDGLLPHHAGLRSHCPYGRRSARS